MTVPQRAELAKSLAAWAVWLTSDVVEFHHGDNGRADEQAAYLANWLGLTTVSHPPSDLGTRLRSNVVSSRTEPQSPALVRNRAIAVASVHGLFGCPRGMVEETRSGTWATIRYARELQRSRVVILPNGAMTL